MKAMKVYITQRFTDWIHERHIAWHGWRLMHARTRPRQLFHWRCMAAGIHARSPAQVARMEAARGFGPFFGPSEAAAHILLSVAAGYGLGCRYHTMAARVYRGSTHYFLYGGWKTVFGVRQF